MELWIRSQDRESLTKVSNVQYTYKEGNLYTDVRGKHYIGTYYDNLKILGEYETKERALEVLDEIQKMLVIDLKITGTYQENDLSIKSNILSNMVKVFIMPEE